MKRGKCTSAHVTDISKRTTIRRVFHLSHSRHKGVHENDRTLFQSSRLLSISCQGHKFHLAFAVHKEWNMEVGIANSLEPSLILFSPTEMFSLLVEFIQSLKKRKIKLNQIFWSCQLSLLLLKYFDPRDNLANKYTEQQSRQVFIQSIGNRSRVGWEERDHFWSRDFF